MFKKSGKGRMKPFCINENCENFLPEDKRGYYRKPAANPEEAPAEEKADEKKPAAKKSAPKKAAAKKTAAKKTTEKKTTTRKKKEAAQ
jgi:DNA topoisomerase-1